MTADREDSAEGAGAQAPKNGRREPAPAFQFYPRDFLSSPKVRRMSAAARGAYITLLCDQWLEGPLDPRPESLADRAGMDLEEFATEWAAQLGRCFEVLEDGRLANRRLEDERALLDARRARLAAAGAKGRKAQLLEDQPQATPGPPPGKAQAEPGPSPGLAGPSGMGWDGTSESGSGSGSDAREAPPHADDLPEPVTPRRAVKCGLSRVLREAEFLAASPATLAGAERWREHLAEKGVTYQPMTWREALRFMAEQGDGGAAAVTQAIRSGWASLWPARSGASAPQERLTAHEQARKRQFAANEAWKDPDALAGFLEAINGTPKPKEINP